MRHDHSTSMVQTHLRGTRLSSRPFYTTILILSVLTAYSFLARTQFRSFDKTQGEPGDLFKRSETLDCNDVRSAKDKCAFVKSYCLDDDAGLIPYLTLYYCSFDNVQPVAFIILVMWLGLLFTTIGIAASDFFSVNLSTIATVLGLSESLAGVTFLAFGNGSPDVFSTFAAMSSNSASMAVGELIGAASFITGVVAGSMALVREFRVDRKTYARDICFFIVAVAFTMFFLADGHLHFWECCLMIGYYVLYVITVVGWHWYSTTRKQKLRREGEARSHVYGSVPQLADELAGEPYRDDPDDDTGVGSGTASTADISALEAGPRIEVDSQTSGDDDDDDASSEDHQRMVAAEVASSMRVLRTRGKRSSTITPIRPSLVGALEFRSALAQLQREGNLQLSHIPGRSHSENHLTHRARRGTTSGIPELTTSGEDADAGPYDSTSRRGRALSSGDTRITASASASLIDRTGRHRSGTNLTVPHLSTGDHTHGPSPSYTIDGNLAPPPVGQSGTTSDAHENDAAILNISDQGLTPQLRLQMPTNSRRSSQSDRSSPSTPFPMYTDSPMPLSPNQHVEQPDFFTPGTTRRDSPYVDSPYVDLQLSVEEPRPVRWWPYSVLPPPHVLLATVFPTLQGWKEKGIWDKFVSAISVPSIFLLVITLPVVESETNSESLSIVDTFGESHRDLGHLAPPISVEPDAIEPESEWERYRRRSRSRNNSRISPSASPLTVSIQQDDIGSASASHVSLGPPALVMKPASDIPSVSNANDETAGWNRWLVCLQLFTGPQFAVIILWTNMREDFDNPGRTLVKMVLYTLLASLILLGVLVVFTTEQKRPRHHYSLCFLGFVISIAWISSIAGEVVGVLKTLGVVLGISEALLGLTIFAAGNSVGDLVADITVARLGYPVMAL